MMTGNRAVLIEALLPDHGVSTQVARAGFVVLGVILLAVSAKIVVPLWPVPMTMGTFAVLTIGAVYGPTLGLATIAAYLICGALGMDVFAGSSASENGLAYMVGPTGGYLVGYVLAVAFLGWVARAGHDRAVWRMALALLAGNAVIYIPGLLWLGLLFGWDQPLLAWGLTPFLPGDAVKLCLAAIVVPLGWKVVGRVEKAGATRQARR